MTISGLPLVKKRVVKPFKLKETCVLTMLLLIDGRIYRVNYKLVILTVLVLFILKRRFRFPMTVFEEEKNK